MSQSSSRQPDPVTTAAAPVLSAADRLDRAESKAEVLVEALPWIRRFAGTVMVVKYGGNAMVSEELRRAFAEDIVFLHHVGVHPVVVHGGGPQINAMLDRLGIASEFRGGLRVTTEEAMDVVRMVLTGQVGRELVGLVNSHGPYAVGFSGEDAGLLRARRTGAVVDGQEVDLGLVGEVTGVDPTAILDVIESGRIPVVSSVAPEIDDDVRRAVPNDCVWPVRGRFASGSAGGHELELRLQVIDGEIGALTVTLPADAEADSDAWDAFQEIESFPGVEDLAFHVDGDRRA